MGTSRHPINNKMELHGPNDPIHVTFMINRALPSANEKETESTQTHYMETYSIVRESSLWINNNLTRTSGSPSVGSEIS